MNYAVQCVLFVTVMMRYYENISEKFNVLGICSVGNDHKQVNKLCNREFVFPASRTRRKRVAVVLPTALLRNMACSAYVYFSKNETINVECEMPSAVHSSVYFTCHSKQNYCLGFFLFEDRHWFSAIPLH